MDTGPYKLGSRARPGMVRPTMDLQAKEVRTMGTVAGGDGRPPANVKSLINIGLGPSWEQSAGPFWTTGIPSVIHPNFWVQGIDGAWA